MVNRPNAPRFAFLLVVVGFSRLLGHDSHEEYDSEVWASKALTKAEPDPEKISMKSRTVLACIAMLMGTATLAVAQGSFVGTWKLNLDKSQLAGGTMKFGPADSQSIELSAGGTKYSFRVDGNNYRMASGDLAQWKQVDPATWTTDYLKPDGKPLSTDTWKLAADNKILSVVSTGIKPNGEHYTDTAVYRRTGGTDGLLGAWQSTEVKLGSPNELKIAAEGLAGISITIPELKASVTGGFGGKDAVPVGPTVPPGLTIALSRVGPSGFRMVQKINGAAVYSARYDVAPDGQTMTETGNSPGDPLQTSVWEKQ